MIQVTTRSRQEITSTQGLRVISMKTTNIKFSITTTRIKTKGREAHLKRSPEEKTALIRTKP